MPQRKVLMGNHAVSYGAMLSRVQVIAAYPITPQTNVVEELSEICAEGRLDAKFIKVESEHSAMACCIGAAMTGCRAFTATSSQGLALMHELLHWASIARLPIVMTNVNRALAFGWNIWCDQTDSLAQRDTGWMQIYCEDNQEVLDNVVLGYKIGEQVGLPVMLTYDAFLLSHTSEPVEIHDQEAVDDFLPPFNPEHRLDVDHPAAFGGLVSPEYYMEFRFKMERAMDRAIPVIREANEEFEKRFGRRYELVEAYRTEGAQVLLITSSSMTSTARVVVDELRDRGIPVGLLKMRFLRPFPRLELQKHLSRVERACVVDRNISVGLGGIFAQEIRAAAHAMDKPPLIFNFLAGLGGRDVTPRTLESAIQQTMEAKQYDHIRWLDLKQ